MSGLKESINPSIGVMSVATNIYFDYWKKMVQSADTHSTLSDRITFFVFTEQIQKIESFSKTLQNVSVKGFEVFPYGWPDATLLRYQIFGEQFSNMTSDALMHLDADMIFATNPWEEVRRLIDKQQICLVQHPGFWRSKGIEKVIFYLKYPSFAIKDLRMILNLGGIGSWETRVNSAAYVPRKFRNRYFCGATWFGPRQNIGEMLTALSTQVSKDQKNFLIARWHDESHLNRWAIENDHNVFTPELCYDETYPQLKKITPGIIAVRKKEMTR